MSTCVLTVDILKSYFVVHISHRGITVEKEIIYSAGYPVKLLTAVFQDGSDRLNVVKASGFWFLSCNFCPLGIQLPHIP